MKKKIFKPVSYILILALGLAITFTSCENTPDPMELPPKESLTIDLDIFPTNDSSKKSTSGLKLNWFYSWGSVAIWNGVLGANLVVPVAAYAEAFNHVPVYQGDNTWEWSYSVTVGVETYVASLLGESLSDNEFSMEMYVSKTTGINPYSDVMWFSGVIRNDHTAASWKMNMDPYNPRPFLDIDYQKNSSEGTADIRYTSKDPQSIVYEGYIEYGIDSAFDYDAYYTIQRAENDITYIEWNTNTYAGRVLDEGVYKDTLWHCWDAQLDDVVCSVE